MNHIARTSLRTASLVAALLLATTTASVKAATPADTAAQTLATSGAVSVKAAGPYVQVGSYRIHVSSHLGRPSAVTRNGTWLYRGFTADDSSATGTLMVRFENGRVSDLQLISATVETAMLNAPATKGSTLIASR